MFEYTINYFDTERGWENTNPGWYEYTFHNSSIKKHLIMVNWLYNNIDNTEKHCRWIFYKNSSTEFSMFKFRYERNYIWFSLSF